MSLMKRQAIISEILPKYWWEKKITQFSPPLYIILAILPKHWWEKNIIQSPHTHTHIFRKDMHSRTDNAYAKHDTTTPPPKKKKKTHPHKKKGHTCDYFVFFQNISKLRYYPTERSWYRFRNPFKILVRYDIVQSPPTSTCAREGILFFSFFFFCPLLILYFSFLN